MKYNGTNLEEVLDAHERWLFGDTDGERADFQNAILVGRNLSGRNLKRADFREAKMAEVNLNGACLDRAMFEFADLWKADLRNTDMRFASFYGAFMVKADLTNATTFHTCFSEANLHNVKNVPPVPMVCPETGSFVGWKKCKSGNNRSVIVKLLIPEDAKRTSGTGKVCRCSKAIVLEIQQTNGAKAKTNKAYSTYKGSSIIEYITGETVVPSNGFDDYRWQEGGAGIHFFISRLEAIEYPVLDYERKKLWTTK